jgi:putative Ca2+/H+ antiporter (TMEM165/GDT1 family)
MASMSEFSTIWTFEPALFASVFALIFVAELPDKTAIATVLLAARNRPAAVFLGAAAAFTVQSFVAVAFGGLLGLLSPRIVHVGAGLLFLGFAWAMWTREGEEVEEGAEIADAAAGAGGGDFLRAAWTSFGVIFIAEWGDLTQLATAALAAKHRRPWTVFLAATAALWCVSALAVAAGHQLKSRLDPRRLEKGAAVMFALVGLYFLVKSAG